MMEPLSATPSEKRSVSVCEIRPLPMRAIMPPLTWWSNGSRAGSAVRSYAQSRWPAALKFPATLKKFAAVPMKFPAFLLGNFAANPLLALGSGVRSRAEIDKIPCIFPVIREFSLRRPVRSRLPAQPPSRGFSSSLPTFLNECGRSAEIPQIPGCFRAV